MHPDILAEQIAEQHGLDAETIRAEAIRFAGANPAAFSQWLNYENRVTAKASPPAVARRTCTACGESTER